MASCIADSAPLVAAFCARPPAQPCAQQFAAEPRLTYRAALVLGAVPCWPDWGAASWVFVAIQTVPCTCSSAQSSTLSVHQESPDPHPHLAGLPEMQGPLTGRSYSPRGPCASCKPHQNGMAGKWKACMAPIRPLPRSAPRLSRVFVLGRRGVGIISGRSITPPGPAAPNHAYTGCCTAALGKGDESTAHRQAPHPGCPGAPVESECGAATVRHSPSGGFGHTK